MQTQPKCSGITLVELLIAMVILSIVTIYAIPSVNNVISKNKVTENANKLISAVQYARNEAITRNLPTALRSATTSNWQDGWTIYEGDRTGSDPVNGALSLRVYGSADADITIRGNSQAGMWLSFHASGMLNETQSAVFYICSNDDITDGVIVTIDRGGRASTSDTPVNDDCEP